MAVFPISKLSKSELSDFWDDLNYLNTAEIKSFCDWHSIPYRIAIEAGDGRRKKTRDDDRKGVMLHRLRHFLKTGVVLPETVFPASVVCFDPLPENPAPDDRLYYGQYDKANRAMIGLLQELTGGHFRNGAIARILARQFWSGGAAPTFREYAMAWLEETRSHTKPNPEWAFLSDRASGQAHGDWKKVRSAKAAKVMKLLRQVSARR